MILYLKKEVYLQAKRENDDKIERDGGENAGLQGCW